MSQQNRVHGKRKALRMLDDPKAPSAQIIQSFSGAHFHGQHPPLRLAVAAALWVLSALGAAAAPSATPAVTAMRATGLLIAASLLLPLALALIAGRLLLNLALRPLLLVVRLLRRALPVTGLLLLARLLLLLLRPFAAARLLPLLPLLLIRLLTLLLRRVTAPFAANLRLNRPFATALRLFAPAFARLLARLLSRLRRLHLRLPLRRLLSRLLCRPAATLWLLLLAPPLATALRTLRALRAFRAAPALWRALGSALRAPRPLGNSGRLRDARTNAGFLARAGSDQRCRPVLQLLKVRYGSLF